MGFLNLCITRGVRSCLLVVKPCCALYPLDASSTSPWAVIIVNVSRHGHGCAVAGEGGGSQKDTD